jgi:hypothetical protein
MFALSKEVKNYLFLRHNVPLSLLDLSGAPLKQCKVGDLSLSV